MNPIKRKLFYYRNKIVNLFYKLQIPHYGLCKDIDKSCNVIVSLTSYKPRLATLNLTIKSLLNQKTKPDKIILYLGVDTRDEDIPEKLSKLEKYGLKIVRGCEDLKPHKKYYFAMQKYPESIIITVDDDVIYQRDTIQKLVNAHKKYPDAVICGRARKIKKTAEGEIAPYSEWQILQKTEGPSFDILPTGVGGVLYPSHSLHNDVFDKVTFMKLCPMADDIWLKYMELRQGTKVVFVKSKYEAPEPIYKTFESGLFNTNVDQNRNDEYMLKMKEEYGINILGEQVF